MLELPEALNMAKQLASSVVGRTAGGVIGPTKEHKFCWYHGDPESYDGRLAGRKIVSAEGFGGYAELGFDSGEKLCINDGVNLRLLPEADIPQHHQLVIRLEDGQALVFTVAMYGGICLHGDGYDNEYYQKSRHAVSPFADGFEAHYRKALSESKPSLSAKAFLATEQRFPGIGNGVLQDILFAARIHPKRKLSTLGAAETDTLLGCVSSTLGSMLEGGGRDTEKDLYGQAGGYRTRMSKNGLAAGCPVCGGPITKEAYLGGSVYYCPHCQPL